MISGRQLSVETTGRFDFWRTVQSHGWCALPPFSHDSQQRELSRILVLNDGTPVRCVLGDASGHIRIAVTSKTRLGAAHAAEIISHVRTCLRLDEDFSQFHRQARKLPAYRWIAATGSGRMLRAPTAFEDVVKMICTTNCTWSLTTMMVTNLVQSFGLTFDSLHHGFPDPGTIAGSTDRYLRTHVKSGYRSPYLIEFAERVAAHKLDPESWRTSLLTTEQLFKEISSVKGVGPYAAAGILKLLGRYDYLGLDSWVRARYYELHTGGRKVPDQSIEKRYRLHGPWRGLFFWLEMTRSWHNGKFVQ